MDENEEKIEVTKKQFDELSALPDVVKNLVEEIKVERTAKQTAEAARDAAILAAKPVDPAPVVENTPEDAETVIRRVLAEQDQEKAKTARETAEQKFKEANKDFHPDNDPAGLKYAAFQRTLAKLNASGAKTEEDFAGLYNDALTLMNRPAPQEQTITPYADSPTNQNGAPQASNQNGLSIKEKKIIDGLGWSEDKYLKLKKSRPAYVDQLLAQAK